MDRNEYSLQTPSGAFREGAEEETVVAAQPRDLGDQLAQHNRSEFAAALLRPNVGPLTDRMSDDPRIPCCSAPVALSVLKLACP